MDRHPRRRTPVHLPPRETFNRPIIIFVTVCTQGRKAILARADVHRLLLDVWIEAGTWLVGRYVLMPDHLHLFCAPGCQDFPPLTRWVQFWKSRSSQRWPRPAEQPVWQKSFWDTQLRAGESYAEKWSYVELNPVRKGLVSDARSWPFAGELNELPW